MKELHKTDMNKGMTLAEMLICLLIIGIIALLMLPIMGLFSKSGITGQFIDYSKVGVCRVLQPGTNECDYSRGLKIYSALGSLRYDDPTSPVAKHRSSCRAINDVADLIKLQNGDPTMPRDDCYVLMDDINFAKTKVINEKGHKERVDINDAAAKCGGDYKCELSNYTWNGIGTQEAPFTGVFLGNGKIIYNMNGPLFQNLDSGAIVQDFGIHNSNYDCTVKRQCGFLADQITGDDAMTIRNVYLSNSKITNDGDGNQNFGGLIGEVSAGARLNLILAYNNSPQEVAGGLIGHSHRPVYFEKCNNTGKITSKPNPGGNLFVGGLLGFSESSVEVLLSHNLNGDVTIEEAAAGVAINNRERVGGFVGVSAGQVTFNKSWVKANITQPNSDDPGSSAGGFIGSSAGTVTVNNSYVVATVRSKAQAGGFVGDVNGTTMSLDRVYSIVETNADAPKRGAIAANIRNIQAQNVLFDDANNSFASHVGVDNIVGWIDNGGVCKPSTSTGAVAAGTECKPYTPMEYSFNGNGYDYGVFLANDFEARQPFTPPYKRKNTQGKLWKNNVYRPILVENPEKVVEMAKIEENPSGVDHIMFLVDTSLSMNCSIVSPYPSCDTTDGYCSHPINPTSHNCSSEGGSRWDNLKNIMQNVLNSSDLLDKYIGVSFFGGSVSQGKLLKVYHKNSVVSPIIVDNVSDHFLNMQKVVATDPYGDKVRNALNDLGYVRSDTYSGPGLEVVLTSNDLIDMNRDEIKKIILITDGPPSHAYLTDQLSNNILMSRDDISVDVIRLGDGTDPYNERVARHGTYYSSIKSPEDFEVAIDEALKSGYTSRKQAGVCIDTKECINDNDCMNPVTGEILYTGLCRHGCCAIPNSWGNPADPNIRCNIADEGLPSTCGAGKMCHLGFCLTPHGTLCDSTHPCLSPGDKCYAGECMPEVYNEHCLTDADCISTKKCTEEGLCIRKGL